MTFTPRFLTAWPVRLAACALPLLLAACETPLNETRAQRFGQAQPAAAYQLEPRALALSLRANADGSALTIDSLQAANALLGRQGRLGQQVLTLTPLNARGAQLAPRLAQALQRSGAQAPRIAEQATDAQQLAQAQEQGWDLELQSEALVVEVADCQIADPNLWAVHPYQGLGALGCANRANLARMVSDPRDLARPRVLAAGDGAHAAAAVQRYQEDDLHELIDISFDEDD
jgi:pilus assembly protein CpaD